MKVVMIYYIDLIDKWTGELHGCEYFLDRKERDERIDEILKYNHGEICNPYHFRLSKKSAWKLNHHSINKEKREIAKLKQQIENLKRTLNARIQLVYENELG